MDVNHVPHAYPEGRNEYQPCTGALLHQRSIEVHRLVLLVEATGGIWISVHFATKLASTWDLMAVRGVYEMP